MEIANVNNTHRSSASQLYASGSALPSAIKDEANNGDIFGGGDSDSDDENGYRPRPQLPQPNVNMRSLASLIKDLESGVIDVDPEYQREVVWTADRMTGLINSLMENYYIPPIILNKTRNAGVDGITPRDTLVCVDGKQRLSSIRAFVKGMIPCHDHKGETWWFYKVPGTNHKRVLSLEAQKLFLEKDFVAFQFTELTPEQEEDLFARVQMGVQLTVAEKMRAKQGPWQELAKLFVDDFPAIYSLMKDRARAKDFQLTLACFSQIMEVKHPSAANGLPILKTNYNALPKLVSNTSAVDDATKSHLANVWTTFRELIERDSDTFTNADKYLSGVQTFAPVEMVAATVLISMYSETRNNESLLGDIRALREALREHFKDLRLNAIVWKFVWNFIENLEAIRGAADGNTVNRNQPDQASTLTSPSAATVTATVSSSPRVPEKRGAHTNKPLSILPPWNSVAEKNEPQPNIAAPKRQRTDLGPPNAQASPSGPVHENINNSYITDANTVSVKRTRYTAATTKHPIVKNMFAQYGLEQKYPIKSTTASPRLKTLSTQSPQIRKMHTTSAPSQQDFRELRSAPNYHTSPHSAPTTKSTPTYEQPPQQSQGNIPFTPDLSNVAPRAYHQHHLPPTRLQPSQQSNMHTALTSQPTPPRIRQTRVSEPSNYRALIALVQPSMRLHSISRNVPGTTQDLRNALITSSQPPNMTHSHPTSCGAFAPIYTDKQWVGIIASASPQMAARKPPLMRSTGLRVASPSATSTTTPVALQRNGRKQKSVIRPTPVQYEGVIDLTSDNELEEE